MSANNGWKNHGTHPEVARIWREVGINAIAPPVNYSKGDLTVLMGREPIGPDRENLEDLRWHVSVSRKDRVPSWEEMVMVAHELRPGVVFCVPMPPRSWWINVHENCLHLWEIRDTNLENQWRSESQAGRSQAPT